jgi:hypothetical protein
MLPCPKAESVLEGGGIPFHPPCIPFAMRRPFLLAALAVALLAVGLALLVRSRAAGRPRRIHVAVVPSSDTGGLDAFQRIGLQTLLSDQLETYGGWSLLEGLPPTARLPEGAIRLRVRATFWDGHLRLEPAWEGPDAPEARGPSTGTPDWAINDLLGPLGLKPAPAGLLRPEDPAGAMELTELLGRPILDDPSEPVARYTRLAARFPGCATAQYGLAGTLYISATLRPEERSAGQRSCEEAFQRARQILPHFPRGTRSYAFFAADTGRPREALGAALDCVNAHPRSVNAALAVAYPARVSGLLDLAEAAMERQGRLTGLPRNLHTATDNSRLYRGDIPGFTASLDLPQAGAQPALLDFYRGYARLLAGQREQALPFFLRGETGESVVPGFRALCRVYALALQDREAEALAALEELARSRQRVQVLDGEFTFKIAEAYGFLKHPKEALDQANQAATQGFLCLAWYERTPLLEGARAFPYWPTLRRHLEERQRLLETQFPLSRMKPL